MHIQSQTHTSHGSSHSQRDEYTNAFFSLLILRRNDSGQQFLDGKKRGFLAASSTYEISRYKEGKKHTRSHFDFPNLTRRLPFFLSKSTDTEQDWGEGRERGGGRRGRTSHWPP